MPNTQSHRSALVTATLAVLLLAVALAGCHGPPVCCDPGVVSREIACRTGAQLESVAPCQTKLPPQVELDDGLDEDEALLTALSNNSAFQATLAQLGMVHGDAVQASLLANPQLLVYFPTGAKEGQYTLYAPIESYFLRPARVNVANREYRRIGDQLVQNGLNLARDVRVAYTDWVEARQQAELAQEAETIRAAIASLTVKRFEDGDISELETIASRVDSLNARASLGVQQQTANVAKARVATLIGIPQLDQELDPTELPRPELPEQSEAELIQTALACRPDLHAANWSVAAARQRTTVARWLWLRLDGVFDVRASDDYSRAGGGIRWDLPLFNRNEGGILRADWELNAAQHARDGIADQITQEVRTAYRQLTQAYDYLTLLEGEIVPALEEALVIAQKGYEGGGSDYLLVLQTTTQYLTARGQVISQSAACNRALAELERSVGRNLHAPGLNGG